VVIVFNQGGGGGTIIGGGDLYAAISIPQIPWASCGWSYQQRLTVTTGAPAVSSGYSASITLNHASLVSAGKSLANGSDLRVMYWNGGASWTELSRAVDPLSSWNSATTKIWFPLKNPIAASSSDSNYYIYYGNAAAGTPPADWANVFRIGDEFNDTTLTNTLTPSKSGATSITETGGELFIDMSTQGTDSGIVITANQISATNNFAIRHKTKLVSGGGSSNPEDKGLGIYQLASQPGVTTYDIENPRRRITMFQRVDGFAWIFYNNTANQEIRWNGSPLAWQVGSSSKEFWGTLSPNTYYIYELISDGTSWYARVSDANGNVLTNTTSVLWSSVRDPSTSLWFYWGDPYSDFYYIDQKSDWVYLRDYVNPEPVSSLGSEVKWKC
jgi:hypothetical protein